MAKIYMPLILLLLIDVTFAKSIDRPNVLFIISDDQGYSDFGFTGNPAIKTPNLDRLAAESAVYKNFVVTPACSPSRSALFTGRDHLSTGVWGIPYRDNLHPDETLMPAWFKKAGYATFYAGKRDMAHPPYTTPWERGWDNGYFVSGYQHFQPLLRNRYESIRPKGWTCDITTNLIINFWKQNSERPWFVTAAYIIPHLPFETTDAFAKPYRDAGLSDELAECYGSITQMDVAIGRLLEGLREIGQEDNTIVVFVSDNGMSSNAKRGKISKPWTENDWLVRNKHGLRGAKSTVWENGIRVPCIFRWPDKISPGNRPQLGGSEDILPTLLDLASIETSSVIHHPLTGVSLCPTLFDSNANLLRPALFRIAISGNGSPKPGQKFGPKTTALLHAATVVCLLVILMFLHRIRTLAFIISIPVLMVVFTYLQDSKKYQFKDHHLALRGPRFKYHSLPDGQSALYDLQSDPQETFDCKSEYPQISKRMAKEIRKRWDAAIESPRTFIRRNDEIPDFDIIQSNLFELDSSTKP